MKRIENLVTDKERALYGLKNAELYNCEFRGEADGESALKETENLVVEDCKFYLRYPLWHVRGAKINGGYMSETCRAPLWYDENISFSSVVIDAPKAIRECRGIVIDNCKIKSDEFGWRSGGVTIKNSSLTTQYGFLLGDNLELENVELDGKYYFQYTSSVNLTNCKLTTKDAFWHSKNATVCDSEINSEYLGWYSENLTLIRCKISGLQPLCYAKNLKLVDCTMENVNLAFENSTVDATIKGKIPSILNPIGKIRADAIGEAIVNEFSRGKCEIVVDGE